MLDCILTWPRAASTRQSFATSLFSCTRTNSTSGLTSRYPSTSGTSCTVARTPRAWSRCWPTQAVRKLRRSTVSTTWRSITTRRSTRSLTSGSTARKPASSSFASMMALSSMTRNTSTFFKSQKPCTSVCHPSKPLKASSRIQWRSLRISSIFAEM